MKGSSPLVMSNNYNWFRCHFTLGHIAPLLTRGIPILHVLTRGIPTLPVIIRGTPITVAV